MPPSRSCGSGRTERSWVCVVHSPEKGESQMEASIVAEIAQLRELKTAALRVRYREVYGEESRSSNREFLFRRIAWRLQAKAEGDLTERARRRAFEIADDSDLRLRAPEGFLAEDTLHQPSPPVNQISR